MRNKENNFQNVIFDNYFLNLVFSVTIPPASFNSFLISLHTHSEGTVSQIFYLGLSFYFMTKIGKHCVNFEKNIFKFTLNEN